MIIINVYTQNNKILNGGKIVNRKWNLMVVTLVALSIIVIGTACAVETRIIGPTGEITDPVDQLPCGTVVDKVNVRYGEWMNTVQMVVKTRDGAIQPFVEHGYGAPAQYPIILADGEYITEVSGSFAVCPVCTATPILWTIEFTTNLAEYGPYGATYDVGGEITFDLVAPDGWQIVGFTTTGRDSPNYSPITSLGVIAIPVAECCNDVECQDTPEDAPCVKCDLETTTCTAPGEGNPHMMCDDGCVNTQNDDFNCGDCGNECNTDAGEKCVSGECKAKKTK
jgi:hypothetical protein